MFRSAAPAVAALSSDASLPELELAAAGLGVLATAPESGKAWDALAALVRAHG